MFKRSNCKHPLAVKRTEKSSADILTFQIKNLDEAVFLITMSKILDFII